MPHHPQRPMPTGTVYCGPLPIRSGERVELVADDGACGHVKKKAPGVYVLNADGNRERSRWGMAHEIRRDIGHFLEFGKLPPASGAPW